MIHKMSVKLLGMIQCQKILKWNIMEILISIYASKKTEYNVDTKKAKRMTFVYYYD